MIKSTYQKTKKQYKVTFELPQDQIGANRDVRVLGSFNDWSWEQGLKLKAGKNGYNGSTELPDGHYQFRYLVDGQHWANDDSVEAYADSGYGSDNCCFSLESVAEAPKKAPAKKAAAKKPAAKKAAPAAKKPAVKKAAPAAKKAAPVKKAAAAKKPAAAKRGDDLKKIEGIGPKIAGLLNEAGIHTFTDLSKASSKKLADVLQEAGARFRLAKYDTWAEQAKLAAAGKMDALKQLQDRLKGGKR